MAKQQSLGRFQKDVPLHKKGNKQESWVSFHFNIIERAIHTQIYGKNEKTLKRFSFKRE